MTPLLKRTKNTLHRPIGYGGPPSLAPQKESILKSLIGRPRDGVTLSSENGLSEIDEVIAKNRKLRNMRLRANGQKVQPMVFGEQKEKNPVRRAFDSYIKAADIPGPYGSPVPKDWTKKGDAFKVGKWNDQVNFVSKHGTTAEKVIQRGALTTGVAATSAAVVTGAAEAFLLNNQSITVHATLAPGAEPYLEVGGRKFFRINPTGDWYRPTAWKNYAHQLKNGSPTKIRNAQLNLRPHYHRRSITPPSAQGQGFGQHRPWQGGF